MFKFLTAGFLSIVLALLLNACNALPKGAAAPKLTINQLAIQVQDEIPSFVITYTLEHNSDTELPVQEIKADIFIKDIRVGSIDQTVKNFMVPNNVPTQYTVTVPVSEAGAATIDSLVHNSLLLLEGSCALTVSFTKKSDLTNFRPADSYQGFIKRI